MSDFMVSKELKELFKLLEEQYGAIPPNLKDYAFVKRKDKIYLITRDIERIPFENIRINSLGLYIIEHKHNQVRLSIEGAQLFGPHATKNVCEIDSAQMKKWICGKDLQLEGEYSGFVILKHGTDYVGSGKYKDGIITNFVPKARRLNEVH